LPHDLLEREIRARFGGEDQRSGSTLMLFARALDGCAPPARSFALRIDGARQALSPLLADAAFGCSEFFHASIRPSPKNLNFNNEKPVAQIILVRRYSH
jgi:hypothetical protein